MEHTLAIGVILAAVTAALYALVGVRVLVRKLDGEVRSANRMFALWWLSLGAIVFAGALFSLAGLLGFTSLHLHIVLTYATLLVLCVSLWALAYYLVFLYTGRRAWLWPLGSFYLAYYLFLVYLVVGADPIAVEVGKWAVGLEYRHEAFGGPVVRALLLLLLVPQVLGAIAYASLFFRVRDRSQRYRIGLVSATIIVWFGASIVASLLGVTRAEDWPVVSRVISLFAASLILMAYEPPAFVRRKLGVRGIREGVPVAGA